jgi:hypothetical protein
VVQVHKRLALEAALQAFEAIQLRDAVYVACPVSSGRRELMLMAELGLYDRDEVRNRHADRWRREVLEPNKADAAESVTSARSRYADRIVINPATFELDGLTQPDYDALCAQIIESHVGHLVLAEGWQYSRGARIEAVQAIEQDLSVKDGTGNPLTPDQILTLIDDAVPSMCDCGIPLGAARALMPDVAPGARGSQPGHATACIA